MPPLSLESHRSTSRLMTESETVASTPSGPADNYDKDEEEVSPNALRVLLKKDTIALEALEAVVADSPGWSPQATAIQREEYPEYAGTKKETASAAEKEDLAVARLCRYHWKLKQRQSMDHTMIKSPSHPTSSSHSLVNKSLLGVTPAEVRRPPFMYLTEAVLCSCGPCSERRELELKADRYWLAGNWDKALGTKPRPCELVLTDMKVDLIFRKRRGRVRKDIDWISPLQKAIMTVTFDQVFEIEVPKTHRVLKKSATIVDTAWLKYEEEIKRVESEIRRSMGSGDWCAEVVVVVCSLQVSWKAYFQSYRTLRFLEAKGVDHFAIDINSDIGTDTVDYNAIRVWLKEELLHRDHNKREGVMNCLVPQVLVDGVPLGTYEEILTMEDENDLDYILAREACPNCLYDRHPDAGHCGVCGAVFHDLISTKFLTPEEIKILLKRNEINAARIKAPTPRDFERRRRQLGFARCGEDLTTWFDPEKMKLFGAPSVGFSVQFDNEDDE